MIEHSAELGELAAALSKAQANIATAKRDSENPFFKSSYADLASVWEACREALTGEGLSVVQFPGFADGMATLDTMLLHASGQWLKASAGAPLGKQDAQGVGSVITYLRRYALAAVASVSPADDDGNAARSETKRPERGGITKTASPKGVAGRTVAGVQPAPTSPPQEPLDQKPAAIVAAEKELAPWDGADYGESVHQDEQVRVFYAAKRAGIAKKEWEGWYEKVRGRKWREYVRVEDVAPLMAAAEARIKELAGTA